MALNSEKARKEANAIIDALAGEAAAPEALEVLGEEMEKLLAALKGQVAAMPFNELVYQQTRLQIEPLTAANLHLLSVINEEIKTRQNPSP